MIHSHFFKSGRLLFHRSLYHSPFGFVHVPMSMFMVVGVQGITAVKNTIPEKANHEGAKGVELTMSPLSEQQQDHLRQKLYAERREAEEQLAANDHFGMEHSQNSSIQELSAYDNHPGDIASELYEREKDLALQEHTELHLIAVIEALERMEDGIYGTCVTCGKPIPYERLEVVPSTRFCVKHAESNVSQRRPIEEIFLQPPFGRTSLDEREDQTQFDGEDAWQIVSEWGTSTSPALAENRNMGDYGEAEFEETDHDGYVEAIESFLATDITGQAITIVRNDEYRSYMANREGDHTLEAYPEVDEFS